MSEDFAASGGLAPGSLVAGYRLEERLGTGGMAVVYQARDERLGRLVALKILAPALAADQEFRRRFTAESRAAAAVDHPHIIPVYEAGHAGQWLFIAMRLVTSGDLRQVLAREGPLPPERAAQFLSPVASALDALHRAGLVHRDVKPGNILVDAHPDWAGHVYLSDFGISKNTKPAPTAMHTETGLFLGTAAYASPEHAAGLALDGHSDQYSLACVAWHLLTGTLPFERPDAPTMLYAHRYDPPPLLADHRPDLPAAAGQVLAKAMAKRPAERYLTCGEFTDALREALTLPLYQPAAAPAAAGHPSPEISSPPAHPATATAGTATGPGGPDPEPGTPPAADRPTQTIATPAPRAQPRPAPASNPARPARRHRRYLTITLAGTLLAAAAAAITLLLTRPAAPQSLTGKLTATLTDPNSRFPGVNSVEFAPDGTTLATADGNGSTYLWDTKTGKLTATFTDPNSGDPGVDSVVFAPDGTTLATADSNGRIYLWDTKTGKLTATLSSPGGYSLGFMVFAPDGTTLITADSYGGIYLWDTTTGKLTATLTYLGGYFMAFAPDSTTLAAGDSYGSTDLWDTTTGKLTATVTSPAGKDTIEMAFAPDGTTLATGDSNGTTYLSDAKTGKLTATLTDPGGYMGFMVFAPDSTTLATGDANGSTYLWDISRLSP